MSDELKKVAESAVSTRYSIPGHVGHDPIGLAVCTHAAFVEVANGLEEDERAGNAVGPLYLALSHEAAEQKTGHVLLPRETATFFLSGPGACLYGRSDGAGTTVRIVVSEATSPKQA